MNTVWYDNLFFSPNSHIFLAKIIIKYLRPLGKRRVDFAIKNSNNSTSQYQRVTDKYVMMMINTSAMGTSQLIKNIQFVHHLLSPNDYLHIEKKQ